HDQRPGLDRLNGVAVDAHVADFADRLNADVTGSANCAAAAVVGKRVAADIRIGVEILQPHADGRRLHAIVLDVAAGLGGFGGLSGHVGNVNADVVPGQRKHIVVDDINVVVDVADLQSDRPAASAAAEGDAAVLVADFAADSVGEDA